MKRFLKVGGFLVALLMVAAVGYAQTLTVGSGSGVQGQTLTIPVTFTNDADNVVGLQFDVTFNTALVDITDATAGSDLPASFGFSTNSPSAGVRRIIITPPMQTPLPNIPDGEIAVLTINIVGASGTAPLSLDNVSMSNATAGAVTPAALNDGTITIIENHTVTFTAGAGGYLTGTTPQTVDDGGDCTPVTAVPDAGYHFTGWTGDYVGTDNPLTITNVTSDMNITANFAADIGTHTVTFTAGAGGYLTGTTPQTVDDGGDCTPVTAVPDAGYHFTGWTGDYVGTDNPLTITNVTSDMNITANFAVVVVGGPADGATLSSDKGTFSGTPTSEQAPAGAPANFIYGLLDFTINGLTPGDTVTVKVTMPGNIPAQSVYYKYQNEQFSQYNNVTGLNDGDQTFIITLTDGGPGDEDGVANGTIVEPGGPGVLGLGGGPTTVPTLNEWGMIILAGSFFILGLYILRRRGTHCAGA